MPRTSLVHEASGAEVGTIGSRLTATLGSMPNPPMARTSAPDVIRGPVLR